MRRAYDHGTEVTKLLRDGWELYGGPVISESTNKNADGEDQTSFTFAQALIKI